MRILRVGGISAVLILLGYFISQLSFQPKDLNLLLALVPVFFAIGITKFVNGDGYIKFFAGTAICAAAGLLVSFVAPGVLYSTSNLSVAILGGILYALPAMFLEMWKHAPKVRDGDDA